MQILLRILNSIRQFPRCIKAWIKHGIFIQNCKLGENVTIEANANCFKDPLARIQIGNNCDICCSLIAKESGQIQIGHHTTIRGETIIGALKSIYIGNYVIISNNVRIYDNNNHPTSPLRRMQMCATGNFYSKDWNWSNSECMPIIIEDNVWICERATILKGITIGKGAIVASNSVVTKDVPQYSIVAGNPAKVVKFLENDIED